MYNSARRTICTGSVESVEDYGRAVSLIKYNPLKEDRRYLAYGKVTLSFGNIITAKYALIITIKNNLELIFKGLDVSRTLFL